MGLSGWIHTALRGVGFDIYHHMAGGRVVPFRIRSIPSVGPLRRDSGRFLGSFEVDIESCTSFPAFSYRNGGWNPHVATLEELIRDPSLRYEDSSLCRLHETFIPQTLQELFLEDEGAPMRPLCDLPALRRLFRYVWAINPALIRRGTAAEHEGTGHHYFGPMSPEKGQAQFERLLRTFRSIEKEGFHPDRYGPVKGYFLADESSYRYVVGSGNHRLAALKVLGHRTVRVGLTTSHPAVVHRSQLASWTIEEGGPFEPETAYALFDKLMTEDGMDKARNLGVVGPTTQVPFGTH